MLVTFDFETRSRADIKMGSWRYASDPSTKVMCLAYKVDDEEAKVWLPKWIIEEYDLVLGPIECIDEFGTPIRTVLTDDPSELIELIENEGTIFEAHNAFFEKSVWRNVMVPRLGFPDIPDHKWRCSAAKCAAHSLPRALGDAAQVLKLDIQKDTEGKKMIQRLCKPRRPSKTDPREYFGSREELERFFLYCARDTETEHKVSDKLPDFSDFEQQIWFIDQEINEAGIYFDRPLVEKIMDMITQIKHELSLETYDLTDGAVLKPTSRIPLLNWLEEQDYPLPNTQGATIDAAFEDPDIPENVYRVLKNVRQCGRSSTAKFIGMLDRGDMRDNRIRDTLMFWGANTGRWSGKGVQFQNLPRGVVKDMDKACRLIEENDLDGIQKELDKEAERLRLIGRKGLEFLSDKTDLMEFFSSVIRGMIKAPDGKDLVVADYSSIEARGVTWAAKAEEALKVFWAGEDIYCDMASTIYGRKITKADSDERQLGKQAILGLGYGMGAKKFLETCRKYNIHFNLREMLALIPEQTQDAIEAKIRKNPLIYFDRARIVENDVPHLIISKFIVDNYRSKYHRIVEFWGEVEDAAHKAVREYEAGIKKRKWIKADPVMFKVVGSFLFCRLPNGRRLAYPFPYMKEKRTLWGSMKDTLHFKGVDSLTRKWTTQTTYGGKLVENIIQAVSRDVMANAMVNVRSSNPDFKIILTVHDELVTEYGGELEDPVKELEDLMSSIPDWAEGFPIEAEGWVGKRYKK